jgi:tRNA threonylcarbamoyladenosine biosynthesis protein TsaE
VTRDARATRALGAALARALRPGAVVLLRGGLGAGKTTFAQGIALGLGIADAVISPSFTLIREYRGAPGRPGMVHMDFYRLDGPADVRRLGLDDYLAVDDVIVVEWSERGEGVLPRESVTVTLSSLGDARRVVLTADGALAEAELVELAVPDGVDAT